MTSLTENEIEHIMKYTGMDLVVHLPMIATPVVYFSRDEGKLNFVTILTTLMKGKPHVL
tara:strand:- start:1262 stop:1438 length:177 start_codon:yes stop_codon:yes gene_type:complete